MQHDKKSIIFAVRERTQIGAPLLGKLWDTARETSALQGVAIEVGVFRGGSARVIASAVPDMGYYGFDTFCGIQNAGKEDGHSNGDFANTSLKGVREYLKDLDNVHLTEGLFPDSAAIIARRAIAFAHIDCDTYQSAKDCCEFIYPRLCIGGIMLFDDYNFMKCRGVKKAVHEYFRDDQVEVLPTKQAIVRRREHGEETKTDC